MPSQGNIIVRECFQTVYNFGSQFVIDPSITEINIWSIFTVNLNFFHLLVQLIWHAILYFITSSLGIFQHTEKSQGVWLLVRKKNKLWAPLWLPQWGKIQNYEVK